MNFFLRCITFAVAIFFTLTIAVAVVVTNMTDDTDVAKIAKQAVIQLIMSILFIVLVLLFYKKIINKISFLNDKFIRVLSLAVIALSVRFICFAFIDIRPRSDFALYNQIATNLAKGDNGAGWYAGVFPHVVGYPFILSIAYKVFGVYKTVAVLLNILISTLTVVLIYFIAKNLKNDWKTGFTAALIYALFPTTILYTSLVSTETIFTFLVLVSVAIFIKIIDKKNKRKITLIGLCVFLGIVCAVTNGVRPFGLVLLTAFSIVFILKIGRPKLIEFFMKTAVFLILFIGSYLIVSQFNGLLVSKLISRDVAKSPYGFNLLVGSNMNYSGMWNSEDSEQLNEIRELPPQKVHDILFDKALQRYKDNGLGNVTLLLTKFGVTWGLGDSGYVSYAVHGNNGSIFDIDKYGRILRKISGMYYIAVMFLCMLYAYRLIKKREYDLKVMLFFLILLGVIAVHIITEAMGRYNFSVFALISIIAALKLESRNDEALKPVKD